MTQQEFELKVKEYLAANEALSKANNNYVTLQSTHPERNNQYPNLEEAALFEKNYKGHIAKEEAAETNVNWLKNNRRSIECAIIAAIPMKNTWIKAGEWAVAYRFNAWGSGYNEIEVVKWNNDLGKWSDKTDYP